MSNQTKLFVNQTKFVSINIIICSTKQKKIQSIWLYIQSNKKNNWYNYAFNQSKKNSVNKTIYSIIKTSFNQSKNGSINMFQRQSIPFNQTPSIKPFQRRACALFVYSWNISISIPVFDLSLKASYHRGSHEGITRLLSLFLQFCFKLTYWAK